MKGETVTAADPPYVRIAAEIRARISSGELRPGDRIPSTRQITKQWGVAKATASKVIDVLGREGVVKTVPRVGTVVAGPDAAPDVPGKATRATRPARVPVRHLSAARIAAAAMAIADEQGLAGLSMRGVAGALEVPTMSLYRYVDTKDQLLDLMADAAFGEIEYPPAAPESWRAHLELAARLQWRVYRRHPWLPAVISLTHPRVLPNLARYGEWTLRATRKLGLDLEAGAMVHLMIANYVRGTATNLDLQAEMEQRTGLAGGSWVMAQFAAAGGSAPRRDELPEVVRAMRPDPGFRMDLDDLFEFGLRRLLDGVGVLVGGRSAR
ncbi:TetR/AcrR family transcriptional regulator C-terminal domain-containing protein [Rhizohabitans arisaemae]|uniref:TetR/AcrR family transcriptional regulator C-terminal domain-containing protein n=1 Tax=Rhizohabitans arisaemae TaxID=2720610 RepID=UPI0024B198E0|nr:TetR/AcrR family transcriptional regulator C-terminal domain-containing protein [Rhizohabitans arisaemae]